MKTLGLRALPLGVAVMFLGAALAACGGDDDEGGAAPTHTPPGAAAAVEGFNNHGAETVRENEVRVEAGDFYFMPTFIRGQPGQQVRLEVTNSSRTLHNITFDGGSDTDIRAGEDVEVTISFPASGVLTFYCKYHSSIGMRGQLLAGDAQPQAASDSAQSTPADSYGY
jgi:plastocyanin